MGAYAIKAAFEDNRFLPLRAEELPDLELGISLLVEFEPASHPEDWEVGLHGIIAKLSINSREYSATYLPEVAIEQGWSQEQTLKSLLLKAGCRVDYSEVKNMLRVTRYKSMKSKISYSEWSMKKATE